MDAAPQTTDRETDPRARLQAAERAFQHGRYRRARALLTPLIGDKDAEVSEAARSLLERLAPDPLSYPVLLVCLLAFAIVAYAYLG